MHCVLFEVFRIDEGGLAQVRSYQKLKSHKEKELSDPNQKTFVVNSKRRVGLSSGKLSLTTEEIIQKAETIQALKLVEANYSFQVHDDSERFEVTFLDSEIAKKYQQGATKIKYNVQFRITLYVKEYYCTMLRMCLFLSSSMKQQHRKSRSNMTPMINTGRKNKTDASLIHLLYPKMEEFNFNLMSKFIRRDKLYTNVDDPSTVKGIK